MARSLARPSRARAWPVVICPSCRRRRTLAGSCNVPLAGFAELSGTQLRLRGLVGAPDGSRVVRGETAGAAADAEALGIALAEDLKRQGAADILAALAP